MKLNPSEIHVVYHLASAYRRTGGRMPPSVAALYERIDRALRTGTVTRSRQEIDCAPAESECVEYVGTRIVAQLLGWSLRTVHRRAADLDGQLVGGSYMFPLPAVLAYRDSMKDKP